MTLYAAESSRLWLQLLNVDDHLAVLFELNTDPDVIRWSTNPAHKSPDETVVMIENSNPSPEKPWHRRYAIMLRPTLSPAGVSVSKPTMIGVIGTPREADIGYKLSKAHWGKGYMTEAIALFLDLFWSLPENSSAKLVKAFADTENVASQRVLEKAGFKKGNVFQSCYVRAVNKESGQRGDMQAFYVERPGAGPVDMESADWIQPHVCKKVVSREDVALIREVLSRDGVERVNRAL